MPNRIEIEMKCVLETVKMWSAEERKQLLQWLYEKKLERLMAQQTLQGSSLIEAIQIALQAGLPEEAALMFIQTEEQANRLVALIHQRKLALSEA